MQPAQQYAELKDDTGIYGVEDRYKISFVGMITDRHIAMSANMTSYDYMVTMKNDFNAFETAFGSIAFRTMEDAQAAIDFLTAKRLMATLSETKTLL